VNKNKKTKKENLLAEKKHPILRSTEQFQANNSSAKMSYTSHLLGKLISPESFKTEQFPNTK